MPFTGPSPLFFYPDWQQTGGHFQAGFPPHSVTASDANGHLFLAESSLNDTTNFYEMRLSKFTGSGSLVWAQLFSVNAGGNVHVGGLAIDGSGNAVVAGSAFNGATNSYDLFVVKYSPGGSKLWQQLFNGAASTYDGAAAVVIGSSNEIFVGGATFQSALNVNAVTRCYDSSGSLVWSQTFDHIGLTDGVLNLVLNGNNLGCTGFAQTGLSSWEFLGIRYDASDGSLINSQVTSQGKQPEQEWSVELLDFRGISLTKQTSLADDMVALPVSNFPSGLYFVKSCLTDGSCQVSKLAISH